MNKRMKKRGQVISFYDIMGLLIFALVMLFWIMVLSPPKENKFIILMMKTC